MRVRLIAAVTGVLLLGVLASLAGSPEAVRARLQEASPEAEATEAPARSDVVTLVAWYQQDPSGEFLTIGPITINQFQVAAAAKEGGLTGRADFDDPDNDDLPRITLGDSIFDAFPVVADDPDTVFRWLYFNDEQGERPATLVIQIECTSSPAYQGYTGTATFISRAADAGGVLVIVLIPPAE